MQFSEDRIQSETVLYFHNNHPETKYCIWAIPNGGSRDAREANKLLSTGVVSGMQDVHILWDGILTCIEFKDSSGQITPPQKACHAKHAQQGVLTYLVRDHKDGINLIFSIIKRKSLDRFKHLISPFSIGDLYDKYDKEAIAYKAKLKAQSKQRSDLKRQNSPKDLF